MNKCELNTVSGSLSSLTPTLLPPPPVNTKVEVRFHVASADWLPQRVKDRLHTMVGPLPPPPSPARPPPSPCSVSIAGHQGGGADRDLSAAPDTAPQPGGGHRQAGGAAPRGIGGAEGTVAADHGQNQNIVSGMCAVSSDMRHCVATPTHAGRGGHRDREWWRRSITLTRSKIGGQTMSDQRWTPTHTACHASHTLL